MNEYLTLVASSGQVNTPPGSYSTIKEWIAHSFLGPQSRVLEIGCSTGFITIEIARYVRATCYGLDLHEQSIEAAKKNTDPYVADRVSFISGDAGQLPFGEDEFSHVVIGGHLPFVPPEVRQNHIGQAVRVAKPWGYVLTALYFYKSPPQKTLLDEFNREIGTRLESDNDLSYWSNLFENQNLLLEYESIYDIVPADSERIRVYLDHLEPVSKKEWGKRLRLFNENGRYLNYFVRVYRKIPKQGTLMIQTPRGGIYQIRRISQRFP